MGVSRPPLRPLSRPLGRRYTRTLRPPRRRDGGGAAIRKPGFVWIRCSMLLKQWIRVALFGLTLVLAGVTMAEDAKEVKFPELPAGAGEIDKEAPKTFTATKSGLKYRILREGKGEKPAAKNTVEVHYHGWLDNGKVF